jgi:hypothetical protein
VLLGMVNDGDLVGILAKGEGLEGETRISVEDMGVLLKYGGDSLIVNKEIGVDYFRHEIKYAGRVFFGLTSEKVGYDPVNKIMGLT